MTSGPAPAPRRRAAVLIVAVAIASMCGLVFELLAGTMSSYLLGDSVQQFSLVIGVFLFGMGLGSWASQWIHERLLEWFCGAELLVGLCGGALPLVGFATFVHTSVYVPTLLVGVTLIGALVGLEIPLVVRLLRAQVELRTSVAHALAADYVGALAASIAFPFVLLPELGVARAGAATGLLNVAVAIWVLARFWPDLAPRWRPRLAAASTASALALGIALLLGPTWVSSLEAELYQDDVVAAVQSPYQRIVITRWRDDVRLFLDGHLQFSSVDEHRYHEALVHPALGLTERPERVCVLGGGDGLAVREVLAHPTVREVHLVDLDPEVVRLFRDHPLLRTLNRGSLRDPRVRLHHADAMRWLEDYGGPPFDVILIDLPDPSTPSVGKLYTRAFNRLVLRHLAHRGAIASQATSPHATLHAYWTIVHTWEQTPDPAGAAPLHVRPYRAHVPSFGEWGFVLVRRQAFELADLRLPGGLSTRFLTPAYLPTLFELPADLARVPTEPNDLATQTLVRRYARAVRDRY